MLHSAASCRALVRSAALLGAIFLAGFCASGARVVIPGLSGDMRGVAPLAPHVRGPNRWRGRARANASRPSGSPNVAVTHLRRVVRWVYGFPTLPAVPALVARAPGVGAKVRRLLFKARGGHGRNGPGAGT
jgi:hypothetical protein